jgi:hypothetical protein
MAKFEVCYPDKANETIEADGYTASADKCTITFHKDGKKMKPVTGLTMVLKIPEQSDGDEGAEVRS